MALQSTPPLQGTQVVTEFSGTLPAQGTTYNRGGPHVTSNNTAIGATPPITGSSFLGATRTTSGSVSYTAGSGSWTVPPYTTITVKVEGGHGENSSATGGTGGYAQKTYTYPALAIGAAIPWVIGAGGAANFGSGNAGTNTTFNGSVIAGGGQGGGTTYTTTTGSGDMGTDVTNYGVAGANGTASGGDTNVSGGSTLTTLNGRVSITWS